MTEQKRGGCMLRKILFWIGLLILSLFLNGCVTTGTTTDSKSVEPVEEGLVISPPDRIIQDISMQPAHVKFVIAAMVNKMRGNRDKIPEVTFDPKGKHAFYGPGFTYDDFNLYLTEITGYGIRNQKKNQAQLVIEGMFHFRDLIGRTSANYFAADYTINNNKITINKSGTALIAPTIPDIEIYFVPKASFDGVAMKEISSFMDLYLHAVLNGFTMEPTQVERQNKESFDKLSTFKKMLSTYEAKPVDCYIMVFCKDRLPPETSVEMKITNNPPTGWKSFFEMGGKTLFETGYVYDKGWRAMIAGGIFPLDDLTNNFYINLQYNTDPESKSKTICVGTYTNQKNYNDRPKFFFKEKKASMALSMDQLKLTPIQLGSIFLDPSNKEDARAIQTRLADTDYYNKKIDGDFGPSSKEALKKFKKNNNMEGNGNWDLKTQKVLFNKL